MRKQNLTGRMVGQIAAQVEVLLKEDASMPWFRMQNRLADLFPNLSSDDVNETAQVFLRLIRTGKSQPISVADFENLREAPQ